MQLAGGKALPKTDTLNPTLKWGVCPVARRPQKELTGAACCSKQVQRGHRSQVKGRFDGQK